LAEIKTVENLESKGAKKRLQCCPFMFTIELRSPIKNNVIYNYG